MRPTLSLQLSTVLLLLASAPLTSAQEWTRFRGPNGSGVSEANLPSQWKEEDYNWKLSLGGKGHSSPVIWKDRVFVSACDEDQGHRQLHCIDAKQGKILWTSTEKFKVYKKHKNNSFASSTPCVDDKHVYVVWHSKQSSPLIALTHDGDEVWRHDLGPYQHGQGGATSPIVFEDMVILANDQKRPSFLLAVDRNTGKERWKIEREGKRACYATPAVFRAKGRPAELVFTHCYEGIVGVEPKTGRQNWHIDVFGRASQRALGSPVFTDELVIATSGGVGGERQLVAVTPPLIGNNSGVAEAWRTNRLTPHVPTPLVYRDWLFIISDQGIASCLDKVTGKSVWKERIGGNYFSSPICAGGKLYCVDLDGNVVVLAATDEFKLLGKVELGEGSKATPAVSNGVLYLRTESQLFSLGQ